MVVAITRKPNGAVIRVAAASFMNKMGREASVAKCGQSSQLGNPLRFILVMNIEVKTVTINEVVQIQESITGEKMLILTTLGT